MFIGAVLAFYGRYDMNPDGMSYMDMATSAVAQGWQHLIHSYWSPLYAALLTSVFSFHPSPSREIPAIQFVNWIIFDIATLCFAFFLSRWRSATQSWAAARPNPFFVPLAFSIFLIGTAQFIKVSRVGPDLAMAVFVFLAAGICCKLFFPECAWKQYVYLGIVLGMGCYAKTPMFVVSAILFVLLFVFSPRGGRAKIITAACVFLAVSAPLIIAESKLAGRFSIGQSGQMAYVWEIDGSHPEFATEGPSLDNYVGRARILTRTPATLEFAEPAVGSYPLWFDPAYWYAETKGKFHFSVKRQLRVLETNLVIYGGAVYYMAGLCGGGLVLFLARSRKTPAPNTAVDTLNGVLVAWAAFIFAMYSLVYVDYRYIGAFVIVFWIAGYGLLVQRGRRLVTEGVLMTVSCVTLISVAGMAVHEPPSRESLDQVVVAETLRNMGIKSGDLVANVGYTYNAYYAQMAQVHVGAQVVDVKRFWSLSSPELTELRQRLTGVGIKAIIARDPPAGPEQNGCTVIKGTKYHRFCVVSL